MIAYLEGVDRTFTLIQAPKGRSSEYLNCVVQGGLCACSGDRKYPAQHIAIPPIPHPGLFAVCSPFGISSGELYCGDLCFWGVLGVGVGIVFYGFAISIEPLMLQMSHLVGN